MSYILVIQKVADYARWKPIFEADGANREIAGSRGGQLFRSAGSFPENLLVQGA